MLLENDKARLGHIAGCIGEILAFSVGKTRADLDTDIPYMHLVLRNLEIVGEAASRISPQTRERYPHINWRAMTSMRNHLIHAYFRIDLDVVWSTVRQVLPGLHAEISELIKVSEQH